MRAFAKSLLLGIVFLATEAAWAAAKHGPWREPEAVTIEGYSGDAMEPFISCDGGILLFNDRNRPEDQTDLHWAEKRTDVRFAYRGKVRGVNTAALEGAPSMDCACTLYFVSVRSYEKTLSTIYQGVFKNGEAADVRLVEGVSRKENGVVNFDVEISPSGRDMISVDGTYDGWGGPYTADVFLATKTEMGFARVKDGAKIFANVNTPALEYAAAMSHDGLELFFTRLSGAWFWRTLTIEHATRNAPGEPWSTSTPIPTIKGYVEAPATTQDGKTLYFHKEVDGRFQLFLVRRD